MSFGHGSNDGQKGMGLIMLILIGTVPTAYALNHAIGYNQVQDFAAVSQQASRVLSGYVSPDAVMGDARNDLTDYIRTKNFTPNTMLAARQLAVEIEHEVTAYKALANVPPDQQQNIRNDMYVESEALRLMAKAATPRFTSPENAARGGSSWESRVIAGTIPIIAGVRPPHRESHGSARGAAFG